MTQIESSSVQQNHPLRVGVFSRLQTGMCRLRKSGTIVAFPPVIPTLPGKRQARPSSTGLRSDTRSASDWYYAWLPDPRYGADCSARICSLFLDVSNYLGGENLRHFFRLFLHHFFALDNLDLETRFFLPLHFALHSFCNEVGLLSLRGLSSSLPCTPKSQCISVTIWVVIEPKGNAAIEQHETRTTIYSRR